MLSSFLFFKKIMDFLKQEKLIMTSNSLTLHYKLRGAFQALISRYCIAPARLPRMAIFFIKKTLNSFNFD